MWNPLQVFARKTTESRSAQSQSVVTRSAAAVTVTSETAMKRSAVYAGIRYLAQAVGQLPWYAYKPRAKGSGADLLETMQFMVVNNVLNGRTNSKMNMSSQRFREIMVTHAILYGNGVAEIERDNAGRAVALYPLRPDRLQFETDGESLEYVYQDDRRGVLRFGHDEVFHIANFGSSLEMAVVGKSVIEYAAESIGWNQATELFGAAYFANGIHPSVLITMKNALSPEAYKIFSEELNRKFGGSAGQHSPFVTDGEITVEKLSVQPDESQFIQSLQHQIDDIARWIGVPPSKIGHMIHAGVRANVEHASIEVVQDAVVPWVRRFELEADSKVFRQGERYFTRMDLSALLRGDVKARAEYYRTMRNLGAINADEIREMEDMNPIPDGSGQTYIVQGQYVRLADVGKVQATQPSTQGPDTNDQQTADRGPGAGSPSASADEELSDEEAERAFRRTVHLFGD